MIKISDVNAPKEKDLRAIDWMIRKIDMNSQIYYAGEYITYAEIIRKREYVTVLIQSRSSKSMINRHIKSLLDATSQMLPEKLHREYVLMHDVHVPVQTHQRKSLVQWFVSFIVTIFVSFGAAYALGAIFHLSMIVAIIIGGVSMYVLSKILF